MHTLLYLMITAIKQSECNHSPVCISALVNTGRHKYANAANKDKICAHIYCQISNFCGGFLSTSFEGFSILRALILRSIASTLRRFGCCCYCCSYYKNFLSLRKFDVVVGFLLENVSSAFHNTTPHCSKLTDKTAPQLKPLGDKKSPVELK